MSVVIVDVHEHGSIPKKLRALLQVHVQALEPLGFCDYLYYGFDNHSITLERKHWSDLINSIDRVEVQLRKATKVANEVGLLVEGVAIPEDDCQTTTYEEQYVKKSGNTIFVPHRTSKLRYDYVQGKLWEFEKAGITVYHSSNIDGTCWVIKQLVEKALVPHFSTLQRYVKTKEIKWNPNPVMETLMGVRDERGSILGEKRAAEVMKVFGSFWKAIHQSPEVVAMQCDGVSVKMWERYLEALREEGRGT